MDVTLITLKLIRAFYHQLLQNKCNGGLQSRGPANARHYRC